jgi:hypothetical protein
VQTKAVTAVFRVTTPGRSALSAVIQARGTNVSRLRRADTGLSLQREFTTGVALTLELLLHRREMCANSATWNDTWCDEV